MNGTQTKQGDLSLRDVLNNLKKRSITDRENGGHGYVRLTDEERKVFNSSKIINGMGRPKKSVQEKKNVVSIRFSLKEQEIIKANAEKHGFSNWKNYLKSFALCGR
jgi:hypothetical protein